MLLYYTTDRSGLFQSLNDKETHPVVRDRIGTGRFLFATEPLAGQGPLAYLVDIPRDEVMPCKFEHPHRKESASTFAVPIELVMKYGVRQETYESVTGAPWNRFKVDVRDFTPRKGETNWVGAWSLVWMSREGIASAKVLQNTSDVLSLEVSTTIDFQPSRDYIVVEYHEENTPTAEGGQPRETWALDTIAGFPPRWQTFPSAWQDWVSDPGVADSGVQFLLDHASNRSGDIIRASKMGSKFNRARAWREVADQLNRDLSSRLGRTISLGKFAGHSWTAVQALPLRIAMRLGPLVGQEWEPPRPKPEFQNPEESGRVLLANNYGAFPTQGPGVDFSPQDMPYEQRTGELQKTAAALQRTPAAFSR